MLVKFVVTEQNKQSVLLSETKRRGIKGFFVAKYNVSSNKQWSRKTVIATEQAFQDISEAMLVVNRGLRPDLKNNVSTCSELSQEDYDKYVLKITKQPWKNA